MLNGILDQTSPASKQLELKPLLDLALRGLSPMFYADRQLFCYRLHSTAQGLVPEGISPRYTMMTLLGLHQAEAAGMASPFDYDRIFGALTHDTEWITCAGDLGLLLWTCALVFPHRLKELTARADLSLVLARYPDVQVRSTMELAWLLAGLSHAKLAGTGEVAQHARLAARVFELLKENQGRSGAFGHGASGWSATSSWRGWIGSFADQVYPIYACSKYKEAYGVGDALRTATACAEVICREQGPLGQWWWHYDASQGRAIGKYPVYSVHQDGMAPLALYALSEAGGPDFDEPIGRGLRWIWGQNELGESLCDEDNSVIWRCIHPAPMRKYSSEMLAMLHLPASPGRLRILQECRPYHFGWLLYAFAGRNLGASTRP